MARFDAGAMTKGRPLAVPASVAAGYSRALRSLVQAMQEVTARTIAEAYAGQAPIDTGDIALDAAADFLTRLIEGLQRRFTALFLDRAEGLAGDFIKAVNDASARNLGTSLKEVSKGVTLKTNVITGAVNDALQASVKANVSLIKTIPQEYFADIEGAVMRSIQSGAGTKQLTDNLAAIGGVTKRRAEFIAVDQTRKAYSAINQTRMKAMGVRKFEWLHSGGGKEPRPLHKNTLNGNVYSMDDPPVIDDRTGEKGFPGQLINCRCRMVPVISFEAE